MFETNHSVENITPKNYSQKDAKKFIEICGRTCYNSMSKLGDDTYERFYKMLNNNKHLSVFEHGTLYMVVNNNTGLDASLVDWFVHNKYSRVTDTTGRRVVHKYKQTYVEAQYFITTNYRVIEECWEEISKLFEPPVQKQKTFLGYIFSLCIDQPLPQHIKRITYKVNTDIGVSREFNRHRCLSVTEQSTRYVDMSKEGVCFVTYPWYGEIYENDMNLTNFFSSSEAYYNSFRKLGWKPQQARKALPLGTRTIVIYTAFEDDWSQVLALRSSKFGATGVHPEAQIIGNAIYQDLKDLSLIDMKYCPETIKIGK